MIQISQNARRFTSHIGGEEAAASKAGCPIATITGAVGSLSQIAMGIPGLSSIAGVVNTVAGIGNSIASAMGWSKPTSSQIITQVRPILGRDMISSDGPDAATQLGLFRDNSLDCSSTVFGTDIDEMSIDYIVRKPQRIGAFNFSTTSAENSLLATFPLNPIDLTTDYMSTTAITTNLGYISSMFAYWKGGINLTFKFAKTSFHSGRIIFLWYNNNGAPPSVYVPDLAKHYAVQLDLKEKFELLVKAPYIQANIWLATNSTGQFKATNGTIAVYVINQLKASGLASNTIECLVEAHAATDFEVCMPVTPQLGVFYARPPTAIPPFECGPVVYLGFNPEDTRVSMTTPWDDNTVSGIALYSFNSSIAPLGSYAIINDNKYYFSTVGTGYIIYRWRAIDVMTFEMDFTIYDPAQSPPSRYTFSETFIYTQAPDASIIGVCYPVFSRKHEKFTSHVGVDDSYKGIDGINITSMPEIQTSGLNALTVGETVKSLRALCKRYLYDFAWSTYVDEDSRLYLVINPHNYQATSTTGATNYLNYLFPAFRFNKGSRRFKLAITSKNHEVARAIYPYYYVPNFGVDVPPRDLSAGCMPVSFYDPDVEGICEFSVPYYNRNSITINGDVTDESLLSPVPSRVFFDLGITDPETLDIRLWSNIGEDFSLGGYLSAPTLTLAVANPARDKTKLNLKL